MSGLASSNQPPSVSSSTGILPRVLYEKLFAHSHAPYRLLLHRLLRLLPPLDNLYPLANRYLNDDTRTRGLPGENEVLSTIFTILLLLQPRLCRPRPALL